MDDGCGCVSRECHELRFAHGAAAAVVAAARLGGGGVVTAEGAQNRALAVREGCLGGFPISVEDIFFF